MTLPAGSTALVTGGASGIGAALARQLASAGVRVTVADIDLDGAERVVAELNASATDAPATAVALDVTDRAAFIEAAAAMQRRCGRIDYLFNNAGIAIIGNVLAMTGADWDRLVDVNVRGVIHGIEATYPIMVAQALRDGMRGHIVNTASVAGLVPAPGFTGYAMSKHAVVGLSVSLREEARRYGVRVSAACPGMIQTPMAEQTRLLGDDRPAMERLDSNGFRLSTAARCADAILRGTARNRALIPVTAAAQIGWRLYRVWPGLLRPVTRRLAALLAP